MEYKKLSQNEMIALLEGMQSEAEACMQELNKLQTLRGEKYREKLKEISSRYAQLKAQAKDIYKYSQPQRNEEGLDEYYASCFVPAIRDIYVHCNAKSNCMNPEELSHSLYDIWDYPHYYLPSKNQM